VVSTTGESNHLPRRHPQVRRELTAERTPWNQAASSPGVSLALCSPVRTAAQIGLRLRIRQQSSPSTVSEKNPTSRPGDDTSGSVDVDVRLHRSDPHQSRQSVVDPLSRSGQRTAVKQRPHQQTSVQQVATSEPVVLHHGREGGHCRSDEVRPPASTACWAALVTGIPRCSVACFGPSPVIRLGLTHG
jgi:hypothetical protein